MEYKSVCDHSKCNAGSANESVRQTLSEMDWERGIWNAATVYNHKSITILAFSGEKDRVHAIINKASNRKDVVNSPDNSGYTALHYAARNGHVDICKILIDNGAFIDTQTRSGKATPLLKAAAAGNEATVKYLIQCGAQLDLQDADGKTALHKVSENQNHGLTTILLEACPKLRSIKDNKGNFAIEQKE